MTQWLLPKNWAWGTVAEVTESLRNGIYKPESEYHDDGVVALRMYNIGDGVPLFRNLKRVRLTPAELDSFGLLAGDILVNRVNSRELVGKSCVIPAGLGPLSFESKNIRLRPQPDVVPSFLGTWLRTRFVRGLLTHSSKQTTGMATIDQPQLMALPLPIAPVPEQKRIVAKLEELTARSRRAKEALDVVPPLLDQLRNSILAAAFRGDLTADWRAKNSDVDPADKLLARIRAERRSRWEAAQLAKMTARGNCPTDDLWRERYEVPTEAETEDLPSVPKSWTWARVEEIAIKVVDGVHKKPSYVSSGIPFLTVKNLTAGPGISFHEVSYITPRDHEEYRKRTDPEVGDILISKDGTLGVTRLITTNRPFSIFVSLALVKPVLRESGPFLELAFQSPIFQERFVSTGSGLQHIHLGDLRDAVLPIVPLAEQEELVRRVRAALERVAAFEDQITSARRSLAEMDTAVLAKAFCGELVPQDPNDEPASVLLERIRAVRGSGELADPRTPRQSRQAESVSESFEEDADPNAVTSIRLDSVRATLKDLSQVEQGTLLDEVFAALWTLGPLDKEEAARRVADHLRQARYVQFERLRADGPLFGQVVQAIESAIKAGRLDRPKRGCVRARKADAAIYSAEDWRHALVASLGTDPMDRDEAIRAAAEWARDNLGLAFSRLRGDGQIVEGLRSAINSAIRRGEVVRHDAKLISRASSAQPAPPRPPERIGAVG